MISPNPFDTARNNRRRPSVFGRAMVVVLVLLLCGAVFYWRDAFAGTLWRVLSPVVQLRNNASQNTVSILTAELASTTAALADRNALYAQNVELKKLLNRPDATTQILAGVLLRPPALPYDTLMIDAGKQNGLVAGELVFAGGSLAIGEVTDVYADTSRITLFSAPGRTYDAQIAPAATPGSVLPLTLEGDGAGSLSGEIPSGSTVVMGDPVMIPGLANSFMGSITDIDAPSGASFETVYVQLPVDIFSLQYVEVATGQ